MIALKIPNYKNKFAISIDLGGTYIKSALVSNRGKIVKLYKINSFAEVNPKKVIAQIAKCIDYLKKGIDDKIIGIGIGAPGIVYNGIVKYPPNFKNWKVVNLKKILKTKFSLPVYIDNDANCAGIAELKLGYGKKFKNFIFLTLGTGIGGAIFIDGKIYRGELNGAGEFGMTTINFNGPKCLGGNNGSVESYIGRNNFLNLNKNIISELGSNIDFDKLCSLAINNNKIAKQLFKQYGFYLGIGLTNYFNLMDSRTAVLAGGISNAYRFFISECKKTVRSRALKTIKNNFNIFKSKINNNAGILGAAMLVFQN
jgi:glucokinase